MSSLHVEKILQRVDLIRGPDQPNLIVIELLDDFRIFHSFLKNIYIYWLGYPCVWDGPGLGSTCIQSDLIRWSIFQPIDDRRG